MDNPNKSPSQAMKDTHLLNMAAKKINEKFKELWPNQKYNFSFKTSGSYFIIEISDTTNDTPTDFNSRGIGIQWFLCFLINIAVQSDSKNNNIIMLLDETGHSLHTSSQKSLVDYLEELSENNQIIYSTHSPFMVNMKRSERLRMVYRNEEGFTVASDDFTENMKKNDVKRLVINPVHAALGLGLTETFLNGYSIVIVEGYTDKLYLEAIEFFLNKGINDNNKKLISFVQANGTGNVSYVTSYLAKEDLPIIILDSDQNGQNLKNILINGNNKKHEYPFYQNDKNKIISIGDITNKPNSTIEDLFPIAIFEKPIEKLAKSLGVKNFSFQNFIDFSNKLDNATGINTKTFLNIIKKYFLNIAKNFEFKIKDKVAFSVYVKKQLLENKFHIDEEYVKTWKTLFDEIINNEKNAAW